MERLTAPDRVEKAAEEASELTVVQVSEDFRFVEEHHDARGSTFVFRLFGIDHLLIYTKAGYSRGGEIHEGYQVNETLFGSVKWVTPNAEYHLYPHAINSPFVIIKGEPHMMESVTDSLVWERREKPLENPVNYYKPYRDSIEARMKETK